MWRLLYGMVLALAFLAVPGHAQTFPELTGQVVDAADLLTPSDEAELLAQAQQIEREKGYQFVIATIPSLEGYDIAEYGTKLGREWGIGRKDVSDGVILIVAPNDRKVRIEVGYGLESVLTDALSSVIINSQIIPKFKEGDMPGGIKAGAKTIATQLLLPAPDAEARAKRIVAEQEDQVDWGNVAIAAFWICVLLFFVVGPLLSSAARRGNKGKRYRRDRDDDDDDWGGGSVIVWGGGDWGGSSGGSSWSGGGGGWSGGGGSFGGGGASGGW